MYQTFGEVLVECNATESSCEGVENGKSRKLGQSVGLPLLGTSIHICRPLPEDDATIDQDSSATL